MRCPESRFPIRIIVFDELKLIIFVSQGLTLSIASLVYFFLCFHIQMIKKSRVERVNEDIEDGDGGAEQQAGCVQ